LIVLDTSGLFTALSDGQPGHDRTRSALEEDPGPFLLSPFVLAELDYLVATRAGMDAELELLTEVVAGSYQLTGFTGADVATARDLIGRYSSLEIGLADASVVVLAERFKTTRVLTLDERHFRVLRPLQGGSFTVLPADAAQG
jgi:predicted nucleic acid-binding protein